MMAWNITVHLPQRLGKRLTAIGIAASLVVAIAGCGTTNQSGGEVLGALGGAAAGGLLGSTIGKGKGRLAAVALGTLAGAYLGRMVVKGMTREDKQMAETNAQRSFEYQPSGSTSSWNNPDSGHYGSVTPQAAYQNNQGKICRDFTSVVVIEGKEEEIKGTACRQPNGVWRIAS